MTHQLMGRSGHLEKMTEEEALPWYHLFLFSVYFFPLLGAIISDIWLGKYRTIIYLSLVYCLGHVALAADETRLGLAVGLALIAIGSGGIKPCVSANVGDQFGPMNQHLIEKVYGWFYLSINLGSHLGGDDADLAQAVWLARCVWRARGADVRGHAGILARAPPLRPCPARRHGFLARGRQSGWAPRWPGC